MAKLKHIVVDDWTWLVLDTEGKRFWIKRLAPADWTIRA